MNLPLIDQTRDRAVGEIPANDRAYNPSRRVKAANEMPADEPVRACDGHDHRRTLACCASFG